MRSVSLDALAAFVAVARVGSVTGGADELGLTQSTVSAQLQALERDLGYRVFDRSSRGVTLTTRGRALLARVGGPVDAAVDAVADATGRTASEHTVFLGGPAEFLSTTVLPRLAEWAGPDLDVRVRFGETSDLLSALEASELDLVLSTVQPRIRGVEFAPLVDEQFVLAVPPALVDAFRADPDAVPVVAYGEQLPIIRRYWRSVFDRRPSALRVLATVPDLRVLAELAAGGVGMTVLPTYLADPYLQAGRLVDPVRPAEPPINTLYLARRRSRPGAAPAAEAVAERLQAMLRD
ncbi:LysR family transcriptional regulator [Agromyces aurantiacus]|uniref:LysR family transcriptional regulator n=1 Tax=Agromyces aurantiacus TaxID=165814 RepID=A0ABV9R432_9MICO|nr:LysR family transcriptional regulator [Agromyces aurantiacus]MBM7503581.1 DNA-binding transcriptional LysR family regulator [Agromyces aurantiacus]